jgi:hypothetical protein
LQDYFDCATPASAQHAEQMLSCTLNFLAQTQAAIRVAYEAQTRINHLLGRPEPTRPFSAPDIDLHNRLQGTAERRLPFLVDEIEEIFGLNITLNKDVLEITGTTRSAAA